MKAGWATPPGYPAGIKQKILASGLDENRKMGSRTRLLRFEPGVYTTAPFVHDHWEEVYLISGDLIVGNDAQGTGGEAFDAPTYACRPPGVYHGPFKSDRGCLLYEFHYYAEGDPPAKPAPERQQCRARRPPRSPACRPGNQRGSRRKPAGVPRAPRLGWVAPHPPSSARAATAVAALMPY